MATTTTTVDASGTFTIPAGITTLLAIEAWGIGGNGSPGLGSGAIGGGAGAWANKVNVAVTPGDVWTVFIDGTSARAVNPGLATVVAAQSASGATPGTAASSTGDNKRDGGSPGAGGTSVGGGGGSAPSDLHAANNGVAGNSGGAGGAATIGTYVNGGAGGNAPSSSGAIPGGGGAGGNGSGSTAGGTAGGGRVAFTWAIPDVPPVAALGQAGNVFPDKMWYGIRPTPY